MNLNKIFFALFIGLGLAACSTRRITVVEPRVTVVEPKPYQESVVISRNI